MRLVLHHTSLPGGPGAKRRVFVGSDPGAFSLTSSFDTTDCRLVGGLDDIAGPAPSGRHDISKWPNVDYHDPNHNDKERTRNIFVMPELNLGDLSTLLEERTREIIHPVLHLPHTTIVVLHMCIYPCRAPLMDREGGRANEKGSQMQSLRDTFPATGRDGQRQIVVLAQGYSRFGEGTQLKG